MSSGSGNQSYIVDPYDSGITDVGVHHRSKRSVWEGFYFNLEAPSVDWRKLLGSEKVGASFGVIMVNLLDLRISECCNIGFIFGRYTVYRNFSSWEIFGKNDAWNVSLCLCLFLLILCRS